MNKYYKAEAVQTLINSLKCYGIPELNLEGLPSIEVDEDAISRVALIKRWDEMSVRGRTEFDQELMVAPSVIPETKEGKWIVKNGVLYCSCCDNDSGFSEEDVNLYEVPLPNYCKDCGAKMKGVE